MPEIPAPINPEQHQQYEMLHELGSQFSRELKVIADTEEMVIARAMGDDAYNLYRDEENLLDEHGADTGDIVSPQRKQYEDFRSAVNEFANEILEGRSIDHENGLVTSDVESYTTATGENRIRYSEYKVRDGVVVADQYDRIPGARRDPEEQRQMQLQIEAGINGTHLALAEAKHLDALLRDYRDRLNILERSNDEEFDDFWQRYRESFRDHGE